MMTAALALDISVRLVSVALAIWASELLSVRRQFAAGGVFGRGDPRAASRMRNVTVLLVIQLACGLLAAALGTRSLPGALAALALAVSFGAVRVTRRVGGDGAEQMAMLVLVTAALGLLPVPDQFRVTAAVAFIAAQLTLSYLVSGVAKLISPTWRGGRAIPLILATYSHGSPLFSRFFARWPALGPLAGWAVIAFECLFVLALFLPAPYLYVALAIGAAFHAACAVTMGLSAFLWAFPATYPCVIVAAALLREAIH